MTDAAYWDRNAARYALRPVSDPDAYEATLARVRSYLRGTERVLELGAGTGTTALKLAPHAASYVATDISGEMIAIGRDKARRDPVPGLEFRQAGVTMAELGGGTWDAVLALNLLHLVPDLPAALATIRDLLPTDGIFISKTPAIAGRWYLRPAIRAMQLVGKAPFVQYLSVDDLDDAIRAAGFEIVETGIYPPSVPNRFVVARRRAGLIAPAAG